MWGHATHMCGHGWGRRGPGRHGWDGRWAGDARGGMPHARVGTDGDGEGVGGNGRDGRDGRRAGGPQCSPLRWKSQLELKSSQSRLAQLQLLNFTGQSRVLAATPLAEVEPSRAAETLRGQAGEGGQMAWCAIFDNSLPEAPKAIA